METEEATGPPRGFIAAMVILMIVVGGALTGVFIFKLQPSLTTGVSCSSGLSCIAIPSNAAVVNFDPVNVTVILGVNNTIKWTNQDTIQHTVVVCARNGPQECAPSAAVASSPFLSQGDAFQVTLNSTGVYHYFCSVHPVTMKATIIVKASSG